MTNKVKFTRSKKELSLIGLTLAWLPLAYVLAYFSQFDAWYMKGSTLITAFLFAGSILSLLISVFDTNSIFRKAWIKPILSLEDLLSDTPKEGFQVTQEDKEWLDMKPIGKEIIDDETQK